MEDAGGGRLEPAFVTGASAGIGRASARRMAREGRDLIPAARREDQGGGA